MENKQVKQAEQKVAKAVGVFGKAVTEIEGAQELLKSAVMEDSFKIKGHHAKIAKLHAEIDALEADKIAKGKKMTANTELLKKLKEFTA